MDTSSKSQPTILVKKADGTSERITLEEFRKRRQIATSASAAQPPQAQVKQEEPEQAQPNSQVQMERVANPPMSRVERPTIQPLPKKISPLIEEKVDDSQVNSVEKKSAIRTPHRAIPLVEETTQSSPPQKKHRAIPLVEEVGVVAPTMQSELHVALSTPVTEVFKQPGRSAAPMDHASLLEEDDTELAELMKKNNTTHSPITAVSFSSSVKIPKDLEARTSALILSWKKGIRDQRQFVEYATRREHDGGLGLSKIDADKLFAEISKNATLGKPSNPPAPPRAASPVPLQSRTPNQQRKPQLNSIPLSTSLIREVDSNTPPSRVMGPVEEAATFTLEDFRRLSRDPKTAGDMVLAKFQGWKDESYLLYLQVRDSWKNSPLFRVYVDETIHAIGKRSTIAASLAGSMLTYPEYLALAGMNHQLEMMD